MNSIELNKADVDEFMRQELGDTVLQKK